MNKVVTRRTKKHYSNEEKKAIVDKFLASGLSKSAFCKQENISASALYRWQKSVSSQNSSLPAFIPVESNTKIFTKDQLIKFKLIDGIEMLISEGISPVYIARVIKEISQC